MEIKDFQIVTTNAKWEKCFVDRTDPNIQNEPMRKSMDLKGFSLILHTAKDGYKLITEEIPVIIPPPVQSYILMPSK